MTEPLQPAPPLDIHGFLGVVRRRAALIMGVTLVVVVLALAATVVRSPRYVSAAQVEVRPLTVEAQLLPVSGSPIVNMETEAARVTQGQVAARAAEMLGFGTSPSSTPRAVRGVDVTVRPNTTYLDISCSRLTSEAAQACANAFAGAYVEDRVEQGRALIQARIDAYDQRIAEAMARVRALKKKLTGPSREQGPLRDQIQQLNTEIAEAGATKVALPAPNPFAAVISGSAELSSGPANKDYLVIVAIATMIGLVLGVGMALFRERWAEPVVDRLTFATALVAPVLAVVPDAPRRRNPSRTPARLPVTGGPVAEGYRVAASTLLHLSRGNGPKVFAVSGVEGGDEASRSAAGLAVALREHGKSVVVVPFDLRTSSMHRYFGVPNTVGITNVLAGDRDLYEVIRASPEVPGLSVIARGPALDPETDGLAAGEMKRVVEALRSSFGFVVADSPPLSRMADVLSLVPLTDGVILAAIAGRTLVNEVESVRSQIEGAGGRIVGGILNVRAARRTSRAGRSAGTSRLASAPASKTSA